VWPAGEWLRVLDSLVSRLPGVHTLLIGRVRVIDDDWRSIPEELLTLELGPLSRVDVLALLQRLAPSEESALLLERVAAERTLPRNPRWLIFLLTELARSSATDAPTLERLTAQLVGGASNLLIIPSEDGQLLACQSRR